MFPLALLPNMLKGKALTMWFGENHLVTFRIKNHPLTMRLRPLAAQYRSIFEEEEYGFPFSGDAPKILDLGSNFGMSILYFKLRYPNAQITGFEADPEIFRVLQKNCESNNFTGVELRNEAVATFDGSIDFHATGFGSGSTVASPNDRRDMVRVKAIDLRKFLEGKRFDMVKMDVEGAEVEVLPHIIDVLDGTRCIVLEYHALKGKRQQLGSILSMFELRGYCCHLKTEDQFETPLIKAAPGDYDNRIVISLKMG